MYDVSAIKSALTGTVPSVCTPFTRGGDINFPALDNIVDFLISTGSKSLLITPGDSLFTIISDSEAGEIVRRVTERTAHRAAVIACGKQWGHGQTMEFAKYCRDAGVDLFIPYAPDWTMSCGTDLLFEFYRAAGEILPVMVLSSMGQRGVPMEVYERLIDQKTGFTSVKDDMPTPYGRRLATLLGGRYGFLSGGCMQNHFDVAQYGGVDGYLPVFTRFCPDVDNAYWSAYTAGDTAECARIIEYYEVAYLDMCAKNQMHFSAVIMGMMEIVGICERWRRAPYSSVSDEQMEILRNFLTEKDLF